MFNMSGKATYKACMEPARTPAATPSVMPMTTLSQMTSQAERSRQQMRKLGLTVFSLNSDVFWLGLKKQGSS